MRIRTLSAIAAITVAVGVTGTALAQGGQAMPDRPMMGPDNGMGMMGMMPMMAQMSKMMETCNTMMKDMEQHHAAPEAPQAPARPEGQGQSR